MTIQEIIQKYELPVIVHSKVYGGALAPFTLLDANGNVEYEHGTKIKLDLSATWIDDYYVKEE